MELEFAGGLFGTSSLDGLEIVTRVNYYLRSKQSRRCMYVSPVSPASTVHIKPRVVGDATKEHPYRLARVSRGVEFYRGAAAAGRARGGVSSLFACLAPNSILASGTVRSPSSLGLTRRHRKKNTHDPKCLARSACRYLQPTNVRVAGNLIAARKSMIWKMDENGILFKFILNK